MLLPLADEGCFWVAPPARAANKKGSGKTQTQLAEEIRRFSAADVASFAAFEEFLERLVGVLDGLFAKPLPDLERLGAVDKLDMLRIGWQLRRLGRQQMREAMRLLPMPVANVLDERFEAEPLKAALAACGLRAAAVGPLSPGECLRIAVSPTSGRWSVCDTTICSRRTGRSERGFGRRRRSRRW